MSGAVGVALAGMVLRLAVVVGLLVALALLARDAFTTTIVAFIVASPCTRRYASTVRGRGRPRRTRPAHQGRGSSG